MVKIRRENTADGKDYSIFASLFIMSVREQKRGQ